MEITWITILASICKGVGAALVFERSAFRRTTVPYHSDLATSSLQVAYVINLLLSSTAVIGNSFPLNRSQFLQ